ncbi:MAG: peptidoglycan DD-metalloendopeptidase family protein [Clostridia bacterium]|nr:peptidoglycan DD-metalloendopeptidase family protein [Clostridia bacterium]
MKNIFKGTIKKILVLSMVLVMLFTFSVPAVSYADDITNKKNELSDINADLAALEKALKSGQSTAAALKKQIKDIESKIYSAQKQINALNKEINNTKAKIVETLAELEALQAEIDAHNSNLNDRLRAMYKNGSIGILSVLLGSKSMSDFLTNMEMSKKIYSSDEDLLEDMQTAYEVVVQKKEELAQLKEKLIAQQEEATAYKAGLDESEAKLAQQKKNVENNNSMLEAQIDELNKEAEKLVAEILALQSKEAYTGGTMCWPAKSSTRVTSPFGNRRHPVLKKYKLHTGIDIGAGMGTDILAANSGKVIKAAYNAGGYGYYVMIDHGGGIVTLYAHSSKLLVSAGDIVVRGQTIAKVGSTGMSTGPHLHFEVRVNGQYVNPLDYVKAGVY